MPRYVIFPARQLNSRSSPFGKAPEVIVADNLLFAQTAAMAKAEEVGEEILLAELTIVDLYYPRKR